jgi:hypothetical protein
MSISDHGFLSPNMADWITKHRMQNAAWFSLAERLNETAQSLIGRATHSVESAGESKLLALLMFTRVLSNFQGMMLMAERGMIVEARTLARTCLESTFCVCALVKGKAKFVEQMLANEIHGDKSFAQWLLDSRSVSIEEVASLRKYLQGVKRNSGAGGARKISVEEMARQGDVHPLYVWYRELSRDASHPTLSAVYRYTTGTEGHDERRVAWGPNCDSREVAQTISCSCSFLMAACVKVNEIVENGDAGQILYGLFKEHECLNRLTFPDKTPRPAR